MQRATISAAKNENNFLNKQTSPETYPFLVSRKEARAIKTDTVELFARNHPDEQIY